MALPFPTVTLADWRAQVEKDLAGASFEKTLVHLTSEGPSILPLYTELPESGTLAMDRDGDPFRICIRHDRGEPDDAVREDLDGGADALWLRSANDLPAEADRARTFLVLEADDTPPRDVIDALALRMTPRTPPTFALTTDPLGLLAQGRIAATDLPVRYAALVDAARAVSARFHGSSVAMASTLPYHDAGADGADEIAFALATGVAYLGLLLREGLTNDEAARQVALQVAVGRDTFVEVCKLRALRGCWQKVLAAADATSPPRTRVHAVCSSRTLTQRDPWVNMLRVTTQVFAAVLGGADLVTPASFDQALGTPSALGRRVARNTGLVLREESHLGRVLDPVGGAYYFETLTDTLAREGWKRFQEIERDGGIADALTSGRVRTRLEAAWRTRMDLVSKRRTVILGVSEFANLDEKLPVPPPSPHDPAHVSSEAALPRRRDAEVFEALRTRAEGRRSRLEASLVPLGPLAESRARVGFAAGFLAAGGIRTREIAEVRGGSLACICGSDERYGAEAAGSARALKAAGVKHVLVAGRPGPLEASLRDAGVDGFIFVGCDVAALLSDLQQVFDDAS